MGYRGEADGVNDLVSQQVNVDAALARAKKSGSSRNAIHWLSVAVGAALASGLIPQSSSFSDQVRQVEAIPSNPKDPGEKNNILMRGL